MRFLMEKYKGIIPYSKDTFEYIATSNETSSYIIVRDKQGYFKTCVYETPHIEQAYKLHLEYIKENYPHTLCINNVSNKYARIYVNIKKKGYVDIPIEHSANANHIYWFVESGEFLKYRDRLNITLKGVIPDDFKVDRLDITINDIEEINK